MMFSELSARSRSLIPTLCLLGIFQAATPQALLAQITLPIREAPPRQKIYSSFDSNPEICDTSSARGWFYWYVDGSGFCHIVLMSNIDEANRQALGLLENSFHTITSGYGLRDTNGEPVEFMPSLPVR